MYYVEEIEHETLWENNNKTQNIFNWIMLVQYHLLGCNLCNEIVLEMKFLAIT